MMVQNWAQRKAQISVVSLSTIKAYVFLFIGKQKLLAIVIFLNKNPTIEWWIVQGNAMHTIL